MVETPTMRQHLMELLLRGDAVHLNFDAAIANLPVKHRGSDPMTSAD